ncbi:hypothetical protein BU23DRAFT_647483 [Bimuria novae-zelandiae CBS 107.79]|uniref:Uncharacterized protein n=1 Tax=Bimuria novae-zelandiae CBS 107.79 TaxID=1447943 RepID=A0A6A5VMG0_9PLEO|nr:hypothetical protein BU23DRAFT_647483 [Bimuria novae-zelandiae CBS 107.79]
MRFYNQRTPSTPASRCCCWAPVKRRGSYRDALEKIEQGSSLANGNQPPPTRQGVPESPQLAVAVRFPASTPSNILLTLRRYAIAARHVRSAPPSCLLRGLSLLAFVPRKWRFSFGLLHHHHLASRTVGTQFAYVAGTFVPNSALNRWHTSAYASYKSQAVVERANAVLHRRRPCEIDDRRILALDSPSARFLNSG